MVLAYLKRNSHNGIQKPKQQLSCSQVLCRPAQDNKTMLYNAPTCMCMPCCVLSRDLHVCKEAQKARQESEGHANHKGLHCDSLFMIVDLQHVHVQVVLLCWLH